MEIFKAWLTSICGATLITSLCKVLITKSKLKNITNIFLSIFVLLYMILPIENVDLNFIKLKENDVSDYSLTLNYEEGYETIISESIFYICKEHNVNIISIEIDSYINDDYCFIVNKLVVDIEDDSQILETENLIKTNLNYEVSVI